MMPEVSPPSPAGASCAQSRFAQLLHANAQGATPAPSLDEARARRLLRRTDDVPFFAHSYALIQNLECEAWTTSTFAEFAYVNGLHGIACIGMTVGRRRSVGCQPPCLRPSAGSCRTWG